MIDRKRWLCIAYAFPPMIRSGTHRTLAFVKHLSRLGWDATVLTVRPRGEASDGELCVEIPNGAKVIHTPCWNPTDLLSPVSRWRRRLSGRRLDSVCHAVDGRRGIPSPFKGEGGGEGQRPGTVEAWVKQALHLPDSKVGWMASAIPAGIWAAVRDRPEVIYSTSPYMTAHLIAMVVSGLTRIPWVADFRDPWMDNPFREIRFASLRRLDARLEAMVLNRASRIVCTTPTMQRSFAGRSKNIAAKTVCIPNGIDMETWRSVRPMRLTPPNVFTLVHAGQFYGRRSPRVLFAGLRQALARRELSGSAIRLVLVGSERYDGAPLAMLAAELGVHGAVTVLGARKHRETMSIMAGADALVLVGAAGAGSDMQVPNKLFEYLGARRPILGILDSRNPAIEILQRSRAETVVCDPDDATDIANGISTLAARNRSVPTDAWAGVGEFSREGRAGELECLFRNLVRPHSYITGLPEPGATAA